MLNSYELTKFKTAFYAEDLAILKRMIIKNSALATEDPNLGDEPMILSSALSMLRNNATEEMKTKNYSPSFSREFTSYVITMGFDPDKEFSDYIGTYVDFAWRAKNVEMGAQIVIGKIEKEWKQASKIYEPNLDAVMCSLSESDDEEFNLMFRGGALKEIGKVHNEVVTRLCSPQSKRERFVSTLFEQGDYFLSPFPFSPKDHDLFAKPSEDFTKLMEQALAASTHLNEAAAEVILEQLLEGDTSTSHMNFAGKKTVNLSLAADEALKKTVSAMRNNPPRISAKSRKPEIT